MSIDKILAAKCYFHKPCGFLSLSRVNNFVYICDENGVSKHAHT